MTTYRTKFPLAALIGALSMTTVACGTGPATGSGAHDSMLAPTDGAPVDSSPVANTPTPALDAGMNAAAEEDLSPGHDIDGIMGKIRNRYYKGMQKCYQHALKAKPDLAGRVAITIHVGASGKVTDAEVEGFDRGVDACIKAEAKKWVFDNPQAEKAAFSFAVMMKPPSK